MMNVLNINTVMNTQGKEAFGSQDGICIGVARSGEGTCKSCLCPHSSYCKERELWGCSNSSLTAAPPKWLHQPEILGMQ